MRSASIHRATGETDVLVHLDLDGSGRHDLRTPIAFLNHLLSHVAVHGLLDLTIEAKGDVEVDEHHMVEDVAICLGQALDRALGERQGISRLGAALVPMVDVSFSVDRVGQLGTQMVGHFLETLALHSRCNLHAQVLYGRNDHHKAEALFKALGRALREAIALDPRRGGVASTKGTLTA
jgi:imidazoleglycerol-phosphate dehydratase